MSSVSAYFELARWQNCLIAAAGVLVGAWWAGWGSPMRVAIAAGVAIALTTYANAFNDALDDLSLIDRKAHPERPIPSGRIGFRPAIIFAHLAAAAAIGLALFLGLWLALLTGFIALLMGEYSIRLKRTGLPANVIVAVLASLPFLYGAWAVGNPRAGLILVCIAAPLHLAREIAKDIDDVPGDLGRRRTVPIAWGLSAARALIVVALVAFAVQIIPVARAWPRLEWLILPALLLIVIGASRSVRGLSGAPRALKAAMVCTMLAFVIARV